MFRRSGGRDRIKTACRERMATQYAQEGEPGPATRAMELHGESGVFRAGGLETASASAAGEGVMRGVQDGREHMAIHIRCDAHGQLCQRLTLLVAAKRGGRGGIHDLDAGVVGRVVGEAAGRAATLLKMRSISVRRSTNLISRTTRRG